MKYCECCKCEEFFEVTRANRIDGKWRAFCPACEAWTVIDIEDYLIPNGTEVVLANGLRGTVTGFMTGLEGSLDGVVYQISWHGNETAGIGLYGRKQFEVAETWKKVRHNGHYIERVCHYPRNQEWSNAPCYGCPDRAKCNYDIFNQLWEYEKTDLPPAVVAEYKKFEDELVRSGLTFADVLKLIEENKKK